MSNKPQSESSPLKRRVKARLLIMGVGYVTFCITRTRFSQPTVDAILDNPRKASLDDLEHLAEALRVPNNDYRWFLSDDNSTALVGLE